MNQPMTSDEFENYLTLLSRMLQLRSGQNEAIAEELRVHLEERFGELTAQGVEPKKAVSIALSEFGDAAALAAKFAEISRLKTRRIVMRSTIGSIFVGILVLGWVLSAVPNSGSDLLLNVAQAQNHTEEKVEEVAQPPQLSEREKAEEATRQKLEKKISVNFIDQPLSSCMEQIEEATGAQVFIDKKSLEDMGVNPEQSINFELKEVLAKFILKTMLEQLDLAYRIDHGVLIVTSTDGAREQLCIRMYDVNDLINVKNSTTYQPKSSTKQAGGRPQSAGRSRKTPVTAFDLHLCYLITQMVAPEGWADSGGTGSLAIYNGVLVVCQNEEGHREVESLLDQLRTKICQRRQTVSQVVETSGQ
jgi:hypothetical protein